MRITALFLMMLGLVGAQEEDKVKVAFVGIELEALAQQVERVTKKSFVFQDQLLKGKKVSLQSEKPITPDEFYRVFQSVLLLHGFALVPSPEANIQLVKIVPATQAAKEPGVHPVLSRGQAIPQGEGVIYYVFIPKYLTSQKAQGAITTALSPAGVATPIPNSDLILVIDAAASVQRAEKLLSLLDVPGDPIAFSSVVLLHVTATQARSQVAEFAQAVDKLATGEAGRARLELLADERLNQLHLVGRAEDVKRAEEFLKSVDRELPSVKRSIAYFKIRHVPVVEIADHIRQFLGLPAGGKGATRKGGTKTAGPLSGAPNRELTGAAQFPAGVTPPAKPRTDETPEIEPAAPSGDGPRAPSPGKDIEVVPIESQNTLVVIATQAIHEEVARILEKLDRRRGQVLIEVAILQVTGDDQMDLGIEALFNNAQSNGNVVSGGTGFGQGTQADPTGQGFPTQQNVSGFTGGAFRFLRPDDLSVLVKAISTKAHVNIMSQPLLLVNDNEDANFTTKVSEPTIVTSQGNTSTQTSFAGFADATTSLSITPQISPDRYLNLKITQSFEEFSGDSSAAGVPPPKISNNVTTMITVPDRHTAILGGFTRDSAQETRTGVPFLMDLPLIGWLASHKTTRLTKSRLYLFVRPRILSSDNFDDLKAASKEKSDTIQPMIRDARVKDEARNVLPPADTGVREAPLPLERPR